MKGKLRALVTTAIISLLLGAMAAGPLAWAQGPSSQSLGYRNESWALGIVVPQGAGLEGGGDVRWGSVANVTAEVALPNITLPDRNVYAILSLMASDGSVMQVATGALPNRSSWSTFAWLVTNSNSGQFSYAWILNASGPEMAPESNVVISIFLDSGTWSLRVSDPGSGQSVQQPFPAGVSPSLRSGDQEVFALESYSKAASTFRDMGNLTLDALFVDGARVVSGFYAYSQWDPAHSPLFVVGSAGATLPTFINLGQAGDGSFFWDYVGTWKTSPGSVEGLAEILVIALLISALALAVAAARLTLAKRNPQPGNQPVRARSERPAS